LTGSLPPIKKPTVFQCGHIVCWFPLMPLSRDEIEKRMVELARKYVETHDSKIIKELYELGRELEKVEKSEKQ
jgi:predicted small metal-binding protein